MLFNSYIFILLFLPMCLIGYFSLNRMGKYTLAQIFVLGMSLWFYGYFNPSYLLVISCSIIFNFGIHCCMKKKHHWSLLTLGLIFNIGILIYFKYMDFFIRNINSIFNQEIPLLEIVLPLGISFFTFQQISFIIDSYRGEVPDYNFLYYASFVTYFPQLIAGPIVTHDELIPQFMDKSRKVINWDNFAKGLYIFSIGLAKKVLIADIFGNAVNTGYATLVNLDTTNALLVILGYTIQIYFDFSGYCDMAIGIGKMMNIDLPMNFNSPYKALTITEFWDRWHMTLTRFFTKYVYIPLGGNRKGAVRTAINILIVFTLSGFWHGASWCFVFWGVCHGIFSIITRFFKRVFDGFHPVFNWMMTFGFINIMWVFFRAGSGIGAITLLDKVLMFNFGEIRNDISNCFKIPEFSVLWSNPEIYSTYPHISLTIFYVVAMVMILASKNSVEKMNDFKPSIVKLCYSVFLMVWSVLSFSGISTFLYFNF